MCSSGYVTIETMGVCDLERVCEGEVRESKRE